MRIANPLFRWYDVGNPDVRRTCNAHGIREIRRHDADDFVSAALDRRGAALEILERDESPNDAGISAEVAAPHGVAEHDHTLVAGDCAVGCEGTAERRV